MDRLKGGMGMGLSGSAAGGSPGGVLVCQVSQAGGGV